jgi:hypothetical protein
MDRINIDLIQEPQIPSVVKVINEAYLFEATFKKDPTRITETGFREMVASRSGRHYVATIAADHPFFTDISNIPADGIIGHI